MPLIRGADPVLLEKGLKHAASLWRAEDGSSQDFLEFVKANIFLILPGEVLFSGKSATILNPLEVISMK